MRFEPLERREVLSATVAGDFNDDGFADLVIGYEFDDVGSQQDTGSITVIYGKDVNGLAADGNQEFHQNSPNVPDLAEANDRFAAALAVGDYNGDGIDDLAVGIPGESFADVTSAGAVQIFYGDIDAGLIAPPPAFGTQRFTQASPGVASVAASGDEFGAALASGDFNDDGISDLAIGVPGDVVGGQFGAGSTHILFGTTKGLTGVGSQWWHQASDGVAEVAEEFDAFGRTLTVGDFDGNGVDDLAIGIPNESTGVDFAGAVEILRGEAGTGLISTGSQLWHQNVPGFPDIPQSGDSFGSSLAAGDYNDDGFDDLAIGVPWDDVGVPSDSTTAGLVHVLFGSLGFGLTLNNNLVLHQNTPGILDKNDSTDRFGWSLGTGDFNTDGRDDLVVGNPGEWLGQNNGIFAAGQVHVVYGVDGTVDTFGPDSFNQIWNQNSPGILDQVEALDFFGQYVAAGDFNNDGRDDLVAYAVGEGLGANGNIHNAGAVNVIYGTGAGLDDPGNQFWHRGSVGILDNPGQGDAEPYNPALVPAVAPASTWWISAPDATPVAAKKATRSRAV